MSSNTPVIQVEGLSKCFHIYASEHDRLKQLIMPRIQRLTRQGKKNYYREFWALDDVTFEVNQGQTVGIIGQNGCGKSTLLQIITGTLEPTLGTVHTKGRIAALLELGSGFNPDFTGIENVYLNASLLGLTKEQIDNKFDYIAAFADIDNHIRHPVKTYSSGMMLRLAFAVQVAVETEVLIIDEALAVGDSRFQLKCFKRLKQLKERGTTILFVSHDIETVRSLCDFGLVLDKGRSLFWGSAYDASLKYFSIIFPRHSEVDSSSKESELSLEASDQTDYTKTGKRSGELYIEPENFASTAKFGVGGAKIDWIKICGVKGENALESGQEFKISCQYSWDQEMVKRVIHENSLVHDIGIGFALSNQRGDYMFGCNTYDKSLSVDPLGTLTQQIDFSIKLPFLIAGSYYITAAVSVGKQEQHIQLQWYEHLIELQIFERTKKAFGLVSVEYGVSYGSA